MRGSAVAERKSVNAGRQRGDVGKDGMALASCEWRSLKCSDVRPTDAKPASSAACRSLAVCPTTMASNNENRPQAGPDDDQNGRQEEHGGLGRSAGDMSWDADEQTVHSSLPYAMAVRYPTERSPAGDYARRRYGRNGLANSPATLPEIALLQVSSLVGQATWAPSQSLGRLALSGSGP